MLFVLKGRLEHRKPICLESLSIFLYFYEKPLQPSFPGRNMQKNDEEPIRREGGTPE
jgi:hypothetical protein